MGGECPVAHILRRGDCAQVDGWLGVGGEPVGGWGYILYISKGGFQNISTFSLGGRGGLQENSTVLFTSKVYRYIFHVMSASFMPA